MKSPFISMSEVLTASRPWPFVVPTAATERAHGPSRTESIRALLRDQGPLSAAHIALELDLPETGLVGALLKADLHAGRAFHRSGRYHWNHDYDETLARELAAAAALLRRHGFNVRKRQGCAA